MAVGGVGDVVYLLRRNETRATVAFWDDVAVTADAPLILRELVREPEVTCDATEAEPALAWARAHPKWTHHPPPVRVIRGQGPR